MPAATGGGVLTLLRVSGASATVKGALLPLVVAPEESTILTETTVAVVSSSA